MYTIAIIHRTFRAQGGHIGCGKRIPNVRGIEGIKMKKLFAMLLIVATMATLFAGCKSDKEVLKVSTSPDFAPMEFCDVSKSGQDQYVGFDMTLAAYIAEELDMELEIVPMSFDMAPAATTSGKVDLAISGFSWTPERADLYNLSDYYYAGDNETEQVVVTLKENEGKFTSAADFAGKKIGAQNSSLQASLCEEQLPDAQIVLITDLSTAIMQLKKGDFDCIAVAKGQADVFMANDEDIAFSGFEFEVDPKSVGNVIVLKKGNDELTEKINEILAKASAAGLYETWYDEAMELAGVDTAQEISYDDDGNVAGD